MTVLYSLRTRLLLVLVAGFTVLIVGSALYLAGTLRDHVVAEFDATLLAKARSLAALTEQEDGVVEFDYTPRSMPEFTRDENPEYFEFWAHDPGYPGHGEPMYRSKGLRRHDPPVDLPHDPALTDGVAYRDLELPDGRAGRVVQLGFVPSLPGEDVLDTDEDEPVAADYVPVGLIFCVARGREDVDRLLGDMGLAFVGSGLLAVLLAALLVWRALATGFRPLDSIAEQVSDLDADHLRAQVGLPDKPRELAPIVDRLNELLQRLDGAFDRERRFTGNVAHELRTPIAELRALAEVGRRWPDDRESVVRFFADVHGVAGRMERVIADLLLLARCQAGVEQAERVPVGLRQLITSTWAEHAKQAAETGLRFRLEMPGGDVVTTSDPGKLQIVVSNVLGNAASYGRPGSEVVCRVTRGGRGFRIEVGNAADPLDAEDLANLTEPFWRKDEARCSGHAGLGLSLVRELGVLLRLDVEFGQEPDGTFRVVLEGRALRADAVPGPAETRDRA